MNMEVQVHEIHPPKLVQDWYTSWASGSMHWKLAPEFGGRVADARRADNGRIAEAAYHLHTMIRRTQFDHDAALCAKYADMLKEWGYIEAARFVSSRRGPARFSGYALEWGRQAVRDGLFRSLWAAHEATPGRKERAKQFSCGERPYARLRDHMQDECDALIAQFANDLGAYLLHGVT